MRQQSIHTIILLVAILFTSFAFGQEGKARKSITVKRADRFYKEFDFKTAADLYGQALNKSKNDLYVNGQLGNCYRFLNDFQRAEDWYSVTASSSETDPIYKFYYAQSLMANGKYEYALEAMNNYYDVVGLPDKKRYEYPAIFESNPRFTIKIEDFNSARNDFSPYQIDSNFYFISNREDDVFIGREDAWTDWPFTQIFVGSVKESGDSAKIKSIKVFRHDKISKRYHEGPMCFDEVNRDIYITRSNYDKKKPVKGANDEVNLKIVKIIYTEEGDTKVDKGFTAGLMAENFNFASDDYSIAYPTVTKDGGFMIFASDMPGGFGGLDLYVAENIAGRWSNPVNLGGTINTPGNDAFPHIMDDGTLYFASNGHLGLGGLDIYSSSLGSDGSFETPVNLHAPINGMYDDFGFYMDDSDVGGYFTSRRPSEFGNDDIYSFQQKSFVFEAIVYDSETNEKLPNAKVTLTNLETNTITELMTDEVGYLSTPIRPNSRYRLDVSKDKYASEQAEFTTIEDDVYAEIPLVNNYGILLDVVVKDFDNKRVIPFSEIVLVDAVTGVEVPKTTDIYGATQFTVVPDNEYVIKASKVLQNRDSIYFSMTQEFNTHNHRAPASLYTKLELKKQCVECEIVIDNIYYDLDKYYIRSDAAYELDKLAKTLRDNPTIHIELSSHTDCRGSVKYNTWLSAKRAESAVNYLIEKGINYSRLTAAGYGETRPVNHCLCENGQGAGRTDPSCTENEHQRNRRTVFSITKF